MKNIQQLKNKRKIVSDNICELIITNVGEKEEMSPAKKNKFLFKVLAIAAINTQLIESMKICTSNTLNKFSPTNQIAN